jgi:hypothetical protein
MQSSHSRLITYVALAQFVPLVLFPWQLTVGSIVALVALIALSGFLGWMLVQRKAWAITLTIFVQGLNVIVRLITLWANVYDEADGFDVPLLLTYVVSAILSVIILSYIDRPQVRLQFGS